MRPKICLSIGLLLAGFTISAAKVVYDEAPELPDAEMGLAEIRGLYCKVIDGKKVGPLKLFRTFRKEEVRLRPGRHSFGCRVPNDEVPFVKDEYPVFWVTFEAGHTYIVTRGLAWDE